MVLLWCCVCVTGMVYFFCKQKTAYEMRISDWSSDVCSSDLLGNVVTGPVGSALVMLGGARQLIRVSWTVLAVMVVSTAILAPWQGVIGVCIAAAFSLALRNVMNYLCVSGLINRLPVQGRLSPAVGD